MVRVGDFSRQRLCSCFLAKIKCDFFLFPILMRHNRHITLFFLDKSHVTQNKHEGDNNSNGK